MYGIVLCCVFNTDFIVHLFFLSKIADIAVRYHSCPEDLIPPDAKDSLRLSRMPTGPLCCNTLVLPGLSSVSGSAQNVCELCLNRSVGPAVASSVDPAASSEGTGKGVSDDRAGHRDSRRCSVLELEAALESYLRHLSVSGGRLTPHAHTHAPPLPLATTCSNVRNTYSPFSHYSACCRPLQAETGNSTHASSDESGESQPSPNEPVADSTTSPPVAKAAEAENCTLRDGISGLRCRTNKTLRFYLLDSHLHWELAARLGATGNRNDSDRTFAAIVDLQDETHYVLDHRGGFKETLGTVASNRQ